jgi:hypothetical protein
MPIVSRNSFPLHTVFNPYRAEILDEQKRRSHLPFPWQPGPELSVWCSGFTWSIDVILTLLPDDCSHTGGTRDTLININQGSTS